MADAAITALDPTSGAPGTEITITGSGLTKTTTLLFFGGVQQAFDWVSDTEISTVVPADTGPDTVYEIEVEKGGIRSSPLNFTVTKGTAMPDTDPALTTVTEGDFATEQEKGGPDPVSAAVEPGPAVQPVGVAPREPYPTGSPDPVPTAKVPHNEAPPEAA